MHLSLARACVVAQVFIAYLSEYMVDAIRGAATDLHVPDLFLGTIIIPIVGNAAEHAAAIIFAAKNKMELSLGIAVGSATQIALFVMPLWIFKVKIGSFFGMPVKKVLHKRLLGKRWSDWPSNLHHISTQMHTHTYRYMWFAYF